MMGNQNEKTDERAAAIADEFPNRCVDPPAHDSREASATAFSDGIRQTDFRVRCRCCGGGVFSWRERRNAEQFGEAELNIRKWAWPSRRPTKREGGTEGGERGRSENYSPGSERASDEGRFFPRCWLAAPRRPSLPFPLCLSVRPSPGEFWGRESFVFATRTSGG